MSIYYKQEKEPVKCLKNVSNFSCVCASVRFESQHFMVSHKWFTMYAIGLWVLWTASLGLKQRQEFKLKCSVKMKSFVSTLSVSVICPRPDLDSCEWFQVNGEGQQVNKGDTFWLFVHQRRQLILSSNWKLKIELNIKLQHTCGLLKHRWPTFTLTIRLV